MAHHHKHHHHPPHPEPGSAPHREPVTESTRQRVLELIVKADTGDAVEAVATSLFALATPDCRLAIIGRGVGDINKNDLLAAATGSRLIIGFNVAALPHIAEECRSQLIEIRLYSVIYTLIEDMRRLIASLTPIATEEVVTGNAKVIALFKSSRKGIILGCQVLDGKLRRGDTFRLISAMGPVYSGAIESLHIERDTVTQAVAGQQVGLKIKDFNRARIGDMVECITVSKGVFRKPWQPSGSVITLDASR